jgi:hypothetical protein
LVAPLLAACPPDVRRQAENALKMGGSLSSVIKCLTDQGFKAPVVPYIDDRSPAARAHDDAWNVTPTIDPQAYHFQPRRDIDAKPGQIAQIEADARPLLADLGFDPRAGASLVDSILSLAKQGAAMTPEARLSLPEKWERDGRNILKGDRYDAALKSVRATLEHVGAGNALVRDLLNTGTWRAPSILLPLLHVSDRAAAWAADRPK